MNETTAAIPPVENSVEYVDVPAPTPKDLMIGIDIGGTGMKGGIVDLRTGNLVSERFRIPTPQPATPQAIAQVARQIVDELQSREIAPEPYSAIGVDFPAVVKNGVVFSAANVDPTWINTDLEQLISDALDSRTVYGINDADAAGLAEATYGQGRDKTGLIAVITLGTGIGSALINNWVLVPESHVTEDRLKELKDVLRDHRGNVDVRMLLRTRDKEQLVLLDSSVRVDPNPSLFGEIKTIFGPSCIRR